MCKQDFPMANRLNVVPRVICSGVAGRHKLSVQGRRNALCLLLAIRRCKWFSGTSPMYAAVMRSNSHIAPNFRIPLTESTHDPSCTSRCTAVSDKRLCQIAQRAMRQMTGYFSGYICKRQPVGRFELRAAAKALPLLHDKIATTCVTAQLAQVVSRMFSALEGRGKLRTAAEEYNLAANAHHHDPTRAEYICTFNTATFSAMDLLNRLEHEKGLLTGTPHVMLQAKKRAWREADGDAIWYNFSDVYGFRPPLERLLYLNPWEFLRWWTVLELLPPKENKTTPEKSYNLTRWLPPMTAVAAAQLHLKDEKLTPGTHYEVNASATSPFTLADACQDRGEYAVFPAVASMPELQRFRSQWILRRRTRPVVPKPKGLLPHKGIVEKERRAMLFSLYLRPWVLLTCHSTAHAPHLANLDLAWML